MCFAAVSQNKTLVLCPILHGKREQLDPLHLLHIILKMQRTSPTGMWGHRHIPLDIYCMPNELSELTGMTVKLLLGSPPVACDLSSPAGWHRVWVEPLLPDRFRAEGVSVTAVHPSPSSSTTLNSALELKR